MFVGVSGPLWEPITAPQAHSGTVWVTSGAPCGGDECGQREADRIPRSPVRADAVAERCAAEGGAATPPCACLSRRIERWARVGSVAFSVGVMAHLLKLE